MPFTIVRNDITRMNVDAVVNAANPSLLGGGGVDGAIHAAAGPELLKECRMLGGCRTGEAKLTKGYRLPAKYVIHTVGPVWHGGSEGEEALLAACYRNSLRLARDTGCESVAFPLISSGVYGYPQEDAIRVAVGTIREFLAENEMTVYLVIFGRSSFVASRALLLEVTEYIDDVYAKTHIVPRNSPMPDACAYGAGAAEDACMEPTPPRAPEPLDRPIAAKRKSALLPHLQNLLKKTDEGFSQALLRMIDEKGMTDAQCYKKANVDRKLFSKIRSNPAYRPSKPTVFAFAVALELSLPETREFLAKAGFALSHSSQFDIILEYFIQHARFDVYEINEVLFHFDMPLLGSG